MINVALIFESVLIDKGILYDKNNDKYNCFVYLRGIAILNNDIRYYFAVEEDADNVYANLKN